MSELEVIHPMGEGQMAFETHAGQVFLETSDEVMTPFGGFVPWAAFLKKAGVVETLARNSPVKPVSPNASRPYDVISSFLLAAVTDGSRFAHVNRLRQDPALCDIFGMDKVVSDDSIRRFFRKVPPAEGASWVAEATRPIWSAIPEGYIMDWDSTVLTRYGSQEGAEVGYNPHKRGRPSHHPLLATIAGTRLCPYFRFRSGKVGTAAQWVEAMEEAADWIGHLPRLNRGDIGFANEELLAWHEAAPGRPDCLFKLRLTKNVKRAIAKVPEEAWEGCPTPGLLQATEVRVKLSGWSTERRVVIGRRLLGHVGGPEDGQFWKLAKYEYEAYVTTLPPEEATAWQVIELYRKRADCENVFDELKNQWGFSGFASKHREVTELAARLLLSAYNLWNLFLRLMEPSRHVEARHGRRWFLFIAARLTKSARRRTWKIAVCGTWWAELKQGYERLLAWINLTAPQLSAIEANTPPPEAEKLQI